MIPTREDFARSFSAAHIQFMHNCQVQGLAEYDDPQHYSPYLRLVHGFSPSVPAQVRNSHIVYIAAKYAAEHPELGIRFKVKGNRPLFYVNGTNGVARLSFKKLGKNLRHRNFPTQQALDFDLQRWPEDEIAVTLPDGFVAPSLWPRDAVQGAVNVVGGYLAVTEAETEFEIYIICPDGAGNAWEWLLTGADIIELQSATDAAETNAATKIRKRRLNVRTRKQEAEDANG